LDRDRYRALFVEHARRLIGEGAQLCANNDPAALPSVYRCFHTLKGMFGQMGYERPHAVSHALEDLCDRLRQDLPADEASWELVKEGFRTLSQTVDAIEARGDADVETDLDQRVWAHLRITGTTGFAIVEEGEPEPAEGAPDGASPDVAIAGIAEILAACRRVSAELGAQPVIQAELPRIEAAVRTIYERLVELRVVAFETLVPALRRLARGAAAVHHKELTLDVRGESTRVDPRVLSGLQGALAHLVNNAVVHGIELPEERRLRGKPRAGRVTIDVDRTADTLVVRVSDDGAGFDVDALRGLAGDPTADPVDVAQRDGISTAPGVDGYAGRGLGLGAVRRAVAELDGTLLIDPQPGVGTRFLLEVPVHERPTRVLLVQAGGLTLGIPTRALAEPTQAARKPAQARPLLLLPVEGTEVVRLRGGESRRVDRIVGEVEALVTPAPFPINRLPQVTGTTVGPDGHILFVVDPVEPRTQPWSPR